MARVVGRRPVRGVVSADPRRETKSSQAQKSREEQPRRIGGRKSMDRPEIEERVKKVLAEQLAVDVAQVVPDARFAEDLNADSLDLVEAVLALEEEWNIEIPEDEMESVKTVGQAVDMVASKLGVS
jgi:acyl carrier protein